MFISRGWWEGNGDKNPFLWPKLDSDGFVMEVVLFCFRCSEGVRNFSLPENKNQNGIQSAVMKLSRSPWRYHLDRVFLPSQITSSSWSSFQVFFCASPSGPTVNMHTTLTLLALHLSPSHTYTPLKNIHCFQKAIHVDQEAQQTPPRSSPFPGGREILTIGALLLLRAIDSSVCLQLQVVSLPAVQFRHDAFKLRLCKQTDKLKD